MARRGARSKPRASFAKRLVIMAKSPVLGCVKRRLGREIGDVAALRFYRNCLTHTVLRLARDPRWRSVLAITPDRDVNERFWPARVRTIRLPQGGGDLGLRMQRLFARLPPGPVVIVGSDIPALDPCRVAEAFKLLGNAEAVFGRALDGGYWLIGLKRSPKVREPFRSVRWSGPHALEDTLANLKGRRIAFAASLTDIDTKDDLRREGARTERLILGDIRRPQRA
jgi:uncharacterized protein